jgi:hypothetical protein
MQLFPSSQYFIFRHVILSHDNRSLDLEYHFKAYQLHGPHRKCIQFCLRDNCNSFLNDHYAEKADTHRETGLAQKPLF